MVRDTHATEAYEKIGFQAVTKLSGALGILDSRFFDFFDFRAGPIRARIRILLEKRCRNQVSLLNLVHKNAISRAPPDSRF